MPRNFVLVHGAWHGGWCWRRVGERLIAAGHRVVAPTLTGLGERRHLLSREVTLEVMFQDVIGVIETEELADVILVGHSFGATVVTGVADRIPERIAQLVFLDGSLAESGQSLLDDVMPAEVAAARRAAAQAHDGGLSLPPPKAAAFGISDPADAAWVERRLTPHPFATFTETVQWSGPVGNGRPKIYLDCTQPVYAPLSGLKTRLRGRPDWPFLELATGHDAMVTAPGELAAILLRLA